MIRFFGHHVPLEMLCLWLLEVGVLSGLIYALMLADVPPTGVVPWNAWILNSSVVLAVTIGATAFAIGLYRPEVFLKTRRLLLNTAMAGILALPVVWVVSSALGIDVGGLLGYDALWPLKICVAWIALLFATRVLFRIAISRDLLVRRVLVAGPADAAAGTTAAIRAHRKGFIEVASPKLAQERLDYAALRRAGIKDVVVAAADDAVPVDGERSVARKAGVRLHGELEFWENQLRRINIDRIGPDWRGPARSTPLQDWVNRLGDVLTSLAFLLVTLPLMLLTALIIRLDSPGPVFYRQERVGLHGQPFTLFKFRSMRVDAELKGPTWASQSDPRITRVGSFLRRTRIDELPQLVNVLRGQMSFIGPRPERPHFVEKLSEVVPHYHDRAWVKPGLTGWAQVNFPYGASIEDARVKLSYDLYYVKHRSLLLDALILIATVRVILFQEGAR